MDHTTKREKLLERLQRLKDAKRSAEATAEFHISRVNTLDWQIEFVNQELDEIEQ